MKKVILYLVIIALILCCAGCSKGGVTQEEYDNQARESEKIAQSDDFEAPAPVSGSEYGYDVETLYEPGLYKVGRDIPAGEYVLYAEENGRVFVSTDPDYYNNAIYSDAFGLSSAAMGVGSIVPAIYGGSSVITIYEGEYLYFEGAIAIQSDAWYKVYYTDVYSTINSTVKVGYDLPAGIYRAANVRSDGQDAYYIIYESSRRETVVSEGYIEDNIYIVATKEGECLKLSNCQIVDQVQ